MTETCTAQPFEIFKSEAAAHSPTNCVEILSDSNGEQCNGDSVKETDQEEEEEECIEYAYFVVNLKKNSGRLLFCQFKCRPRECIHKIISFHYKGIQVLEFSYF